MASVSLYFFFFYFVTNPVKDRALGLASVAQVLRVGNMFLFLASFSLALIVQPDCLGYFLLGEIGHVVGYYRNIRVLELVSIDSPDPGQDLLGVPVLVWILLVRTEPMLPGAGGSRG